MTQEDIRIARKDLSQNMRWLAETLVREADLLDRTTRAPSDLGYLSNGQWITKIDLHAAVISAAMRDTE
jgi:hypothetical protein